MSSQMMSGHCEMSSDRSSSSSPLSPDQNHQGSMQQHPFHISHSKTVFILDFSFWTFHFGLFILDFSFWTFHFGLSILDFSFWTFHFELFILDFSFWTFHFGLFILDLSFGAVNVSFRAFWFEVRIIALLLSKCFFLLVLLYLSTDVAILL